MTVYRNAATAFLGELAEIVRDGSDATVRDESTRELIGRNLELERPLERCITIPGRGNSIVAAVAETVWVLAGRNDLAFLSPYLPRAAEFSDDGEAWRGGYGPRLRNWNGVDQVSEVRQLLLSDPTSRRGVLTIFDPDRDFLSTRDVPCNNWLHFIQRDGRLDLHVAVRSNDIWWGFSGINTFEWSVLHEAMAYWLGAEVGRQRYFISSLHLYKRHFTKAERILGATPSRDIETISRAAWATAWTELASTLERWFEIESQLRRFEDAHEAIEAFNDPLLRDFLRVLQVEWALRRDTPRREIESLVQLIQSNDLRDATTLYLRRFESPS